ncbi:AMP-binding protein [Streptomyces atriruber]|uniref:AMP-binding protein n=1 Tax=Streptomyces atriruber TaxID=545121 RepID=A0ABV3BKR3_9ACTN
MAEPAVSLVSGPNEPRATEIPFGARPPDDVTARMRERGWWRDRSIIQDLLDAAAGHPDAPAVVAARTNAADPVTIGYAQLALHAERFGAALLSLGIRRGDRVAFQLPGWWEAAALTLACTWTSAVAVPLLPTMRSREIERLLRVTGASLCVVPDTWGGHDYAAALDEVAPRLPELRHRVVYGDKVPDGAVDFATYFLDTEHETRLPHPLEVPSGRDLDDVTLVMFTSGTTGERKAVLHTENTLYAGTAAAAGVAERGWDTGEVFCSPHPISGLAGLLYCLWGPIIARGTGVYLDTWNAAEQLELMTKAQVTQVFAAPPFAAQLVEAQRAAPRRMPDLRFVMCGGAPVVPKLVADVTDAFSVPVRTCWGMTELGMGIRTPEGGPPPGAVRSDGRPLAGLETSLREVAGEEGLHRLWVRGPSVCTAVWSPGVDGGTATPTWTTDEGWMDTGDLVRDDGAGGVHFEGRASRRVGGPYMIPVADVEGEILHHPDVREAVIIGYTGEDGQEHACAVLAPRVDRTPDLAELRAFLSGRGMTEWYIPERVLAVAELPKNENGKVIVGLLRPLLD